MLKAAWIEVVGNRGAGQGHYQDLVTDLMRKVRAREKGMWGGDSCSGSNSEVGGDLSRTPGSLLLPGECWPQRAALLIRS